MAASEGIPKCFGDYVLKCTFQDNAALALFSLTFTAAMHVLSGHVYIPESYDGTGVEIRNESNSLTSATIGTEQAVTTKGSWQRVWQQVTPDAGDLVGNWALGRTGSPSAGAVVYLDGVQVEAQPLSTPYVHTDGGTASRTAARIRVPNIRRYLNETQGWVAGLMKMPYADTALPNGGPGWFSWGGGTTDHFRGYLVGNAFKMRRVASSAGTESSPSAAFSSGDLLMGVGAWTATAVKSAVNGGAFTSAADTNIPNLSAVTSLDIGTDSIFPPREIDADVLFFALGVGTLTDANAKALNHIARNNRIDSRPKDLPGGCTAKWPPADGDISRMLVAA